MAPEKNRLIRAARITFAGSDRQLHREELLLLQHKYAILPVFRMNKVIMCRPDHLDTIADILAPMLEEYEEAEAIDRLKEMEEYKGMHAEAVEFNGVLF